MELKDTVRQMLSSSYVERFIAEYEQVMIRYNKLNKMVCDWDNGRLNFIPTCSRAIYEHQLYVMKNYIDVLIARAEMENITLPEMEEK